MENTKQLEKKDTLDLILDSLKNAMSYKTFREQTQLQVKNNTSSSENDSEILSHYTVLNHSRMNRWDKTLKFQEDIINSFKNFKGNITWLVLTESWCGDAAHSLPIMNRLSELNDNISLKIILRDKNKDLMNAFLTNGSMSIPKIIVFDNQTQNILGDWGPRPSYASQLVNNFKEKHGSLTPEFKKDLQVWYNKNKGKNIAEDLESLLPKS
ncbi:MAG: thioredoxin family protein [Flavobacteriales bacterium]